MVNARSEMIVTSSGFTQQSRQAGHAAAIANPRPIVIRGRDGRALWSRTGAFLVLLEAQMAPPMLQLASDGDRRDGAG
ncbi:hypothetical protein C8035_v001430 [Colletotrichum spinosum]|uniref:Uncharacterized protein n=1 Tax=Colletotrichum spinosum TaxID=1347390 RepID=A0A4R8Q3U2_9PEZI|nr:hypothetical protein C8035_v001430 [Colletotrichum spinosum]